MGFGIIEEDFMDSLTIKDLEKLYQDLNYDYFDGDLPFVKMNFFRSKDKGAVFRYSYDRVTGEIVEVKGIFVSKFFDRDEEDFITILLHEMIHVWVVMVYRDVDDSHGPIFMKKLKEIERKSGLKLPVVGEGWKLSERVKTKEFDVFINIYEEKNNFGIAVFKKGFFDEFFRSSRYRTLENVEERYIGDRELYVVRSNNRELLEYPQKRKFDFVTYKADKRLLDSLLLNGKILYSLEKEKTF